MLKLTLNPHNHARLIVPPSDRTTVIVVYGDQRLEQTRVGIEAPRQVSIVRSDARFNRKKEHAHD